LSIGTGDGAMDISRLISASRGSSGVQSGRHTPTMQMTRRTTGMIQICSCRSETGTEGTPEPYFSITHDN
jgi:hypothetical protein